MPELIMPHARVHRSFLAAMAEFQSEGMGGPDDDSNTGQAIRAYASRWADPAEFARYLRELRDEARQHPPQHGGRVPQTTLWWVSGDEYLGRISIRHRLTARLTEIGGHIGYDVRPSATAPNPERPGHRQSPLGGTGVPSRADQGSDPNHPANAPVSQLRGGSGFRGGSWQL